MREQLIAQRAIIASGRAVTRAASDASAPVSTRRAIGLSSLASVVSALPSFLLSGFAIFMAERIGLGPSELGTAIAAFYLGSAVISLPGGRLIRRIGSRRGMIVAGTVTFSTLLTIAVGVRNVPVLAAVMALGGAANGVGQVASNVALAGSVPVTRQGLAFGLKQASAPAATLLSGATIPLIALTVGWRWGFVAGASGAFALLVGLIRTPGLRGAGEARLDVPTEGTTAVEEATSKAETTTTEDAASGADAEDAAAPTQSDAPGPTIGSLVVIAAGVSCAAAVGMSIVTFYISSIVDGGVAPRTAGFLLMAGSISGILARTVLGWSADRRERGHLAIVSALLTLGGVGCVALSYAGSSTAALLVGTLLGFACGWGWPGLFFFAVIRISQGAAARTMSVTQLGMFLGALTGPLTFGRVAAGLSFAAAWRGAAVVAIVGAVLLVVGVRLVGGPNKVLIVPSVRPQASTEHDDLEPPSFDPDSRA